jgi:hypothetical protein
MGVLYNNVKEQQKPTDWCKTLPLKLWTSEHKTHKHDNNEKLCAIQYLMTYHGYLLLAECIPVFLILY